LKYLNKFFSELVNDEEFQDILVVVFFNKFDLFKDKISTKKGYESWNEQFPDFAEVETRKDDENSLPTTCVEFLEQQYRGLVQNEEKVLFFHPTTAIDRDQTEIVFESLKMKITLDKLSNSGFNI